mmetsp:Transcript_17643/g.54726  ORF Transcript_17643/g.54726 Transcript_17643/m.54726 type:complete len:211 (-) Transcript_17643:340-972(-)
MEALEYSSSNSSSKPPTSAHTLLSLYLPACSPSASAGCAFEKLATTAAAVDIIRSSLTSTRFSSACTGSGFPTSAGSTVTSSAAIRSAHSAVSRSVPHDGSTARTAAAARPMTSSSMRDRTDEMSVCRHAMPPTACAPLAAAIATAWSASAPTSSSDMALDSAIAPIASPAADAVSTMSGCSQIGRTMACSAARFLIGRVMFPRRTTSAM